MADQPGPYFIHDRHALYAGWVLGIAKRNGLPLEPIYDDAGNFTDRIYAELKGIGGRDVTITLAIPPPPDDWVAP